MFAIFIEQIMTRKELEKKQLEELEDWFWAFLNKHVVIALALILFMPTQIILTIPNKTMRLSYKSSKALSQSITAL